jgi:dTMP kinase
VWGLLVAFEGLDQSGKETQARRLAEHLRAERFRVEEVSFPDYETSIGIELRRALAGERDYTPEVMQLLYIANRYEWRPRIERSLQAGDIVVCDRYLASSVAYGETQGLDAAWLIDTQRHLPQPDLTLLLDIAPATAVARKATGRDRYERDVDLLARARSSYERQAQSPGWHRIDGERDRDAIARDIIEIVAARLAAR